jgi:hypothetical protein
MQWSFIDMVLIRVQSFMNFCVGWKDEGMLSFKFGGDVNEF